MCIVVVGFALGAVSCAHDDDGGFLSKAIAQGDGKRTTVERTLEPFERVRVRDGVELELTAGKPHDEAPPVAEVTTDRNLVDSVVTRVANGTLVLEVDRPATSDLGFEVGLQTALPNAIEADEAAMLHLNAGSEGRVPDEMAIRVLNGARLRANELRLRHLALEVVRGAEARVNGGAETLEIHAAEGAIVEAGAFVAGTIEIRASTGAEMSVCTSGSIRGRVDWGSSLVYGCTPEAVELDVGGGAAVRPRLSSAN